jgi:hypothetical protein
MDEYNRVISKYNQLCEMRNDNKFWAENIIEATENVTSPIVWQNFYAYIANNTHVFSAKWQESLGEQVDQGLQMKCGNEDQQFETNTVQNGNVTYIKMTPMGENLKDSNKDHGKQMDIVSQGVPEEKSDT